MPRGKKRFSLVSLAFLFFIIFSLYSARAEEQEKKITAVAADMVLIPAGEFTMGSNESEAKDAFELCKKYYGSCQWDWFKIEMPKHKVVLDAYSIDKYEVTNAQYKACVNSGKCTKPSDTKWYDDAGKANHPVVAVDWNQSSAYCKWAGKRLPTEAEWEKASRGVSGNIWPWGNKFDCKKSCNSVPPCKQNSTCAAGSFSSDVSSSGVYDMGGNVWEWVADWYDGGYYKNSPDKNPKGPGNGAYRVLRGGSWYDTVTLPVNLRGAYRINGDPAGRFVSLGFRCAQ